MKKLVAGLLSLAMLVVSFMSVRADADLLETLLESVDQIDMIDDQATVCRILTSWGHQKLLITIRTISMTPFLLLASRNMGVIMDGM